MLSKQVQEPRVQLQIHNHTRLESVHGRINGLRTSSLSWWHMCIGVFAINVAATARKISAASCCGETTGVHWEGVRWVSTEYVRKLRRVSLGKGALGGT